MKSLITLTAFVMLTAACNDSVTEPELVDAGTPQFAVAQPKPGKIVFAGHNGDVYSMNQDGTNLLQLTSASALETGPALSPDGSQIVYVRDGELWLMYVTGRGQRFLAYGSQPAWSPDGQQIAFTRLVGPGAPDNDIFVIDVTGAGEYRVTNNSASDTEPTWSPDGTELAFTSTRLGGSQIFHIFSDCLNCTGGGQVTFNGGRHPAWSPDGTMIAYSVERQHPVEHDDQIYLAHVGKKGFTHERITFSGLAETHPAWSPSGDFLVFVRDASVQGNDPQLFSLNVNLLYPYPLHQSGDEPSWGPVP